MTGILLVSVRFVEILFVVDWLEKVELYNTDHTLSPSIILPLTRCSLVGFDETIPVVHVDAVILLRLSEAKCNHDTTIVLKQEEKRMIPLCKKVIG